jgi:hypothetical protein
VKKPIVFQTKSETNNFWKKHVLETSGTMEVNQGGRHRIKALDDTNYASWSFQMKLMLQNEGVWQAMNQSLVEFAGEEIQEGNEGWEQYNERVNQHNQAQARSMELIGMNVSAREIKRK